MADEESEALLHNTWKLQMTTLDFRLVTESFINSAEAVISPSILQ